MVVPSGVRLPINRDSVDHSMTVHIRNQQRGNDGQKGSGSHRHLPMTFDNDSGGAVKLEEIGCNEGEGT